MPYIPKSKKTKITDPEKERLFGRLLSNDNIDDINGIANVANTNESKINNINLQVSETQEQLAFLGQEVQTKQDILISGSNIKTVNGNSLLGSGDIPISGGGGVSDGDKGDITVTGSGTVWTIDNSVVTNAKINDVAASKVTQDSLHRFVADTEKTTWNGKADLVGGKVPSSQIPSIAITEFLGTVASQAAMLALLGEQGDWCIRSDEQSGYVLIGNTPSLIGDWQKIVTPASPVSSVNSQVGNVVLGKSDVGLSNVDNTSDANKPVSIDQAIAIGLKQDALVSGTNIKTIEGQSLLGSGNIDLTKSDVGLSNVDNTSDANKIVSTAQATAIGLKQDTLVSGTNIKTIGGSSILGAGNLPIPDPAGWTTIVKSASQDVTGSTLVDDSELQFSVVAGGNYLIELIIATSGNGSTNDYQFRFALSSGLMIGAGSAIHRNASSTQTNSAITALNVINTNSIVIGQNGGTIPSTSGVISASGDYAFYVNSNATLKFQFACASGTVSAARTWKGSILKYKRID